MTNPSQHIIKMSGNAFNPRGINIRLVCAPGMLWIEGLVFGITKCTVREFRDPSCYEMVNVIRNCPDCNGFISVR